MALLETVFIGNLHCPAKAGMCAPVHSPFCYTKRRIVARHITKARIADTGFTFSAGAGICARRRTHFLLLRHRNAGRNKVSKEKATRLPVTLRFAAGTLRCSRRAGSARNSLHFVPLKQRAALFPPSAALLGTVKRDPGGDRPWSRNALA